MDNTVKNTTYHLFFTGVYVEVFRDDFYRVLSSYSISFGDVKQLRHENGVCAVTCFFSHDYLHQIGHITEWFI